MQEGQESPITIASRFLRELRSRTEEPIERLCASGESLLEATAFYIRQENLPERRERVLSSLVPLVDLIDLLRMRGGYLTQINLSALGERAFECADFYDEQLGEALRLVGASALDFEAIRLRYPPPF